MAKPTIIKRPKKIFFLITKGNFGGAQRYVFELATALPKSDFDVTVIAGQGDQLAEKLRSYDIKTITLPELGRDIKIKDEFTVLKILIKIFREQAPDIIHLNSSKIGALGSLAGRLAGVPKIIFTAHGWAFNEDRPWWAKKIIASIHWLTILLAHQTIAVSQKAYNDMARWPLAKGRMKIIYNGLSAISFLNKNEARKKLLPEKIDKFWIGTIAELHPNKGVDILAEAFMRLVRELLSTDIGWTLTLVIIGGGELRPQLEKFIADKRLIDRIILLGRVEDARRYLKAFDLFVLPSRTEAFPYALLEAGAAGLPVVASEVGGIPEIIPDYEKGILTPRADLSELVKSLKYMINKPAYRDLAGANLQDYVRQNFRLGQMIEKTVKLYRG